MTENQKNRLSTCLFHLDPKSLLEDLTKNITIITVIVFTINSCHLYRKRLCTDVIVGLSNHVSNSGIVTLIMKAALKINAKGGKCTQMFSHCEAVEL